MGRNPIPLLILLAGSTACEDSPPPSIQVADSAGVTLTLSPEAEVTFATFGPQPVLNLGGRDASGPTQFFRIQNLHLDGEGRVWVANGQTNELRIFNPDGTLWKQKGGRGEGPGEFLRIQLLGAFRGDSVAVWDGGLGRLSVFDRSGDLVHSVNVHSGENSVPRAQGVFQDGTLLVQFPTMIPAGALEPGQILGDSARLVRIDGEGSVRQPQGSALGPTWVWTGRDQVPLPFTTNAGFDVVDGAVHLVSGPSFRIKVFRNGVLVESYGVAREERVVSEGEISAYRAFTQEYIPESRRRDYLDLLGHPLLPEHLPAYSRLLISTDGFVWAQVYSPDPTSPETWDVYNPAREWVGEVTAPSGFRTMQIMGSSVAGVWYDDLGVEHVQVYEIRRD